MTNDRRLDPIVIPLADGREGVVYMQIFGTARLLVGALDSSFTDDSW